MVCHAVQTAMSFPDWVAALDEMLPKLASAMRFALATAALEGDKYQPAPSQKGKPGPKSAAPAKKSDLKVIHHPLRLSFASCTNFCTRVEQSKFKLEANLVHDAANAGRHRHIRMLASAKLAIVLPAPALPKCPVYSMLMRAQSTNFVAHNLSPVQCMQFAICL